MLPVNWVICSFNISLRLQYVKHASYNSLWICCYDRINNMLQWTQPVTCPAHGTIVRAVVIKNESTPNPSNWRIQQQCEINPFNGSSDSTIVSHLSLSPGIPLRWWLCFSLGCFTDGFLLHALVETAEPEERKGPVLKETRGILYQYECLIGTAMTLQDSVDDHSCCLIINLLCLRTFYFKHHMENEVT